MKKVEHKDNKKRPTLSALKNTILFEINF